MLHTEMKTVKAMLESFKQVAAATVGSQDVVVSKDADSTTVIRRSSSEKMVAPKTYAQKRGTNVISRRQETQKKRGHLKKSAQHKKKTKNGIQKTKNGLQKQQSTTRVRDGQGEAPIVHRGHEDMATTLIQS